MEGDQPSGIPAPSRALKCCSAPAPCSGTPQTTVESFGTDVSSRSAAERPQAPTSAGRASAEGRSCRRLVGSRSSRPPYGSAPASPSRRQRCVLARSPAWRGGRCRCFAPLCTSGRVEAELGAEHRLGTRCRRGRHGDRPRILAGVEAPLRRPRRGACPRKCRSA